MQRLQIGVSLLAGLMLAAAQAREVEANADGNKDWLRVHRLQYVQNSQTLAGPALVAGLEASARTFASAVNGNTQANRPGEYATFAQRAAYYDLIALVIEFEPTTKPKVKPVRFFHATNIVTLRSMLGFPTAYANSGWQGVAQAFGACFAGAATTAQFIERVNVRLFELNMPVINNLLFKWGRPQHPTSGSSAEIDAYAFDLAMVEMEQAAVERELLDAKPSKAVLAEINKLYACDGAVSKWVMDTWGPLGDAKKWADRARNGPFDFSVKAHRVQMGQALVTLLHKKSEADFRKVAGVK